MDVGWGCNILSRAVSSDAISADRQDGRLRWKKPPSRQLSTLANRSLPQRNQPHREIPTTLNSRENIFRREPPTCLRLPFNFHAVRGRPYTKENICRKPIQRAANNMHPALSNKSGNKAPRYRKTRAAVNLMNALDIDRLRETKGRIRARWTKWKIIFPAHYDAC